jgi:pimeloyl-ACP methyl ester carboxylesterase
MKRLLAVTKRLLVGALVLVIALSTACVGYRAYRLHQFAKPLRTPNGIDEARFVRVGGIDQWVTIRGQDRDNPVLLVVHGGPGFAFLSQSPWAFLSWERAFTVVQWDQRGAGRTYRKSGPLEPGITIERMALDGVEVAEWLRTSLHKPRIVLVGLSWGSLLGIHMVKARPDLFSAYVGTGQVVNIGRDRTIGYRQLLEEARRRSDRKAIEELEALGPPPYASTSKAYIHTKWANTYEPSSAPPVELAARILFDSPITPLDLYFLTRGIINSQDHFRDEIEAHDLSAFATTFDVPIFIFQGAFDNVAPVEPVTAYMARVRAPHKELILIPNSGHNAIVNRSDAFLSLLIDRVRPFAH